VSLVPGFDAFGNPIVEAEEEGPDEHVEIIDITDPDLFDQLLGSGGGSGGGGTSATSIPDGTVAIVVDSSTGEVGTATFNASTGAFEVAGSETTVVVESSSSESSSTGGSSFGGAGEVVSPPSEEQPVPESGSLDFVVPPSHYVFHNVSDTRQETDCVSHVLIFRIATQPVATVPIRVKVRAPRFSGGRPLTPERAAQRAAVAATNAAPSVVEALDVGAISPDLAPRMFRERMQDAAQSEFGKAWEVFACP
jgi:hypothetical protein